MITKDSTERAAARRHEMNRRARKAKANGRLHPPDLSDLFERPTACHWCGVTINFMAPPTKSGLGRATLDHVVPLNRGGRGSVDNIVPCCWACNSLRAMIDHGYSTPRQVWCKAKAWGRETLGFVVDALASVPESEYRR